MAKVVPFKAIRPESDKVHLVASRSVDGYNTNELNGKLSANPYTFLHVINPDYSDGIKTKPGSKERLLKIKQKFKSFVKERVFQQDSTPCYYIYRQIKDNHTYTGIIACTSIDDYVNGVIKIHEQTLTQREEKLKDYLDVCEFNAEPVLFFYPNDFEIDVIVSNLVTEKPDYDFTTTDKIRHTVWVVSQQEKIISIQKRFEQIPHIYIADGHHRSASATLLGKQRQSETKHYSGKELFNYYLGAFFPESQLSIFDYNRTVKDLNGFSKETLIEKISEKFEVNRVTDLLYKPSKKHIISMYIQNEWYALKAKEGTYTSSDPVNSLDAFILTEHILSPILNIHDLKTDKRISFIPGIKGAEALKQFIDEGKADVAFGLYPVTMDHLKWIADTNNIMPPKSTWVEPKMRSGLLVYSIEE